MGQFVTLSFLGAAIGGAPWALAGEQAVFSWQKPHAKVLPTGGLEWAPETFVFAAGKTVRYVDFATGSDANDGASREKPWKHHPWDPAAGERVKAHRGPTTYVFKRGVVYRGQFIVPAGEHGTAEEGSFLIEAHFRTEPGHKGSTLVSKMAERGYELSLEGDGRLTFLVCGDATASAATRERVNDGKWHHVVGECDRGAKALCVYLDGKMAADARGGRMGGSLANSADFLVGKGAKRGYLAGAIDFLRVCRGTLADAKTTIEEFYAWEFDGPQHRDFCGRAPVGRGRDAGAIELVP